MPSSRRAPRCVRARGWVSAGWLGGRQRGRVGRGDPTYPSLQIFRLGGTNEGTRLGLPWESLLK